MNEKIHMATKFIGMKLFHYLVNILRYSYLEKNKYNEISRPQLLKIIAKIAVFALDSDVSKICVVLRFYNV